MTEKELMKLQNGSDVRGIALEGVEGEKVNLRPEAANLIAAAFVKFLRGPKLRWASRSTCLWSDR